MEIEAAHRVILLDLARASILDAVGAAPAREPASEELPAPLGQQGASFVTLSIDARLRGCIGSIVPARALASDVWGNARRTALEDPRFQPLSVVETAVARLEISVLGPLEEIRVEDEAELLAVLRPGVDGLLMTWGQHRATFLPKVWDSLARPEDFLLQLKRKMGLPDDFWHEAMAISRYGTTEFGGALDN